MYTLSLLLVQKVGLVSAVPDKRRRPAEKLPPRMNCQVIHCDCESGCIVAAMRLVNMNLMTADKVAQL